MTKTLIPSSQAEGRGFESRFPLQKIKGLQIPLQALFSLGLLC